MESQSAPPRKSARDRLLAAADELFYENCINLVGIDRVIEHAGVAKASLYDCFGSKEELIRAYIKGRAEKRQARIGGRSGPASTGTSASARRTSLRCVQPAVPFNRSSTDRRKSRIGVPTI